MRGLFILKKSDSSVGSVIRSLDGALTEINMKKLLASTINLLGEFLNLCEAIIGQGRD